MMKRWMSLVLAAVLCLSVLAAPREAAAQATATFIDASLAGATGNGVTDDTRAIQAALDQANARHGGVVVVSRPGVYIVSSALQAVAGTINATDRAALVISANTQLSIARGVTIRLKAGSNCYMLINRNAFSTTVRDSGIIVEGGVWDQGNAPGTLSTNGLLTTPAVSAVQVIDSPSSYPPDALVSVTGSTFVIAGDQRARYANTSTFRAVLNDTAAANTTYVVAGVPTYSGGNTTITVASTGGATVSGLIYGAGNPQPWNGESMLFRRVDGLTVRGLKMVYAARYCLWGMDLTDAVFQDILFDTFRDGLHFGGPVTRLRIRGVHGFCNDNMIAFILNESATYLPNSYAYYGFGHMTDFAIEDIFPSASATIYQGTAGSHTLMAGAKEPIRIAGPDTSWNITDFVVRNVVGEVQTVDQGVLRLSGTCPVRRGVIEKINCIFAAGSDAVLIQTPTVSDIVIRDIQLRAPGCHAVHFSNDSGNVIPNNIVIDGVYGDKLTGSAVLVDSGCAVAGLSISNVKGTGASGGKLLQFVDGCNGTTQQFSITNCDFRAAYDEVNAVTANTNFKVTGDQTAVYTNSSTFRIEDNVTSGANTSYTVSSAPSYSSGTGLTTIPVTNTHSATVSGRLVKIGNGSYGIYATAPGGSFSGSIKGRVSNSYIGTDWGIHLDKVAAELELGAGEWKQSSGTVNLVNSTGTSLFIYGGGSYNAATDGGTISNPGSKTCRVQNLTFRCDGTKLTGTVFGDFHWETSSGAGPQIARFADNVFQNWGWATGP